MGPANDAFRSPRAADLARAACLLVALYVPACSDSAGAGGGDAGGLDAALASDTALTSTDNALSDSVLPPTDAGAADGGTSDLGMDVLSDVPGDVSPDAPTDGATDVPGDVPGDAPTDAAVAVGLAIPCTDTADQVYVPPGGLAPLTPEHRGDVVRCTVDPGMDLAAVTAAVGAAGDEGVTATYPVDVYRIAFRTMRGDVAEGISSARVYLPHGARGPQPMVVVGHPSEGLAASCATSRNPNSLRDLALPWATRGYTVIAPDYAGLGTPGTQGYLDNADTARSLLDGARALRRMVTAGAVGSRIVLAGYSQGGGAVLAAQGLVRSYGADGDVVAAVVFAPEWPSRANSFQLVSALRQPDTLTIGFGITTPVVATLMAYAWYENHVGMGQGPQAFPAAQRALTPGAVQGLCLTAFGGFVQGTMLHVRDWMDNTLRTGFLACVDAPGGPGCTHPGIDFYQFVQNNAGPTAGGDPLGAPVFYVQGMADVIMPPAQEAACNLDRLHTAGVSVEVCTDNVALHTNVVPRNIRHAIAWTEARLAGTTYPPCTGPALPACTP